MTQQVAALRSLAAPVANAPPTAVASSNSSAAVTAIPMVTPPDTNGVTGVKVGHSALSIPAGTTAYDAPADWYFPTQADGSVAANGVIWLQHGFLANKNYYSSLATTLAQQTNSIVVAPVAAVVSPRCGVPGARSTACRCSRARRACSAARRLS